MSPILGHSTRELDFEPRCQGGRVGLGACKPPIENKMIRQTIPCCQRSDDMMFFEVHLNWGEKKSKGVSPCVLQKLIRKTIPYCKHSNDRMLFTASMDCLKKRGDWGNADPLCANKMIRKTLPCCKHSDDMMLSAVRMNWSKRGAGLGGRLQLLPPCKQDDRKALLCCKIAKTGCFSRQAWIASKVGTVGGVQTPMRKQNDPRSPPLLHM